MCLLVSIFSITDLHAQFIRMRGNANFGGSFFGSDVGQGIRVDYSKYLSSTFVVQPALFYEWGKPLQSSYNNVGADVLVGLIPFDIGQKLALFLKGGVTGSYERLTGLEKDLTGFSAGVKGGGEVDFVASESLTFSFYAYQTYLAKKVFGRNYYQIGIGLKINLYDY